MQRLVVLAPLRHRPYRLLLAAQAISTLGDWLTLLAIAVLIVYRWGLGPAALASFSMALLLPHVLIGPIAGVWVDRLPTRPLLVASDIARSIVALSLVIAPNLPVLLILVALSAGFSALTDPAWQSTLRAAVPDDDLLAANALSQFAVQMTKVLGPAAGGVLVSVSGPKANFAADALTFLASAAFLVRLPTIWSPISPTKAAGRPKASAIWHEFAAGFRYILNQRTLAFAVGSMAIASFVFVFIDSLGAVALKELGVSERLLGLVVGAIGLGALIGAAIVGQWGARFSPQRLIGFGELGAAVAMIMIGLGVRFELAALPIAWLPVWLLVGFSGSVMVVPYGYVLQSQTPIELMGRVAAAAIAMTTAFQLAAPPAAAISAAWLGIGVVFAGLGSLLLLVGVVGLFVRLPASEHTLARSGIESSAI